MNTYPPWFARLPEIIEQLALMTAAGAAPYIDRNACEALLDVRREAATKALKRLGASQLGRSLVISRPLLMARLRELMEHPDYSWYEERRSRVADTVNKAKAQRALLIEPARHLEGLTFEELPGVTITSEELRIRHCGSQDLKQKLYALAKAMAADPEGFDAVADGKPAVADRKPKTLTAGG